MLDLILYKYVKMSIWFHNNASELSCSILRCLSSPSLGRGAIQILSTKMNKGIKSLQLSLYYQMLLTMKDWTFILVNHACRSGKVINSIPIEFHVCSCALLGSRWHYCTTTVQKNIQKFWMFWLKFIAP